MSEKDLAKTYQKKTEKEHILSNPDTYIGSVETTDTEVWTYDTDKVTRKTIAYNPGLYKLFDEFIVNCRDHVVRMIQRKGTPVTYIDVTVDKDSGEITMINDGDGIDIEKHPEHDIWIPELVFANLRTSTNYDKEEKRIGGGRNGIGSKICFIWSIYGYVEVVDTTRGLKIGRAHV